MNSIYKINEYRGQDNFSIAKKLKLRKDNSIKSLKEVELLLRNLDKALDYITFYNVLK